MVEKKRGYKVEQQLISNSSPHTTSSGTTGGARDTGFLSDEKTIKELGIAGALLTSPISQK
jgi:hypothetical protein